MYLFLSFLPREYVWIYIRPRCYHLLCSLSVLQDLSLLPRIIIITTSRAVLFPLSPQDWTLLNRFERYPSCFLFPSYFLDISSHHRSFILQWGRSVIIAGVQSSAARILYTYIYTFTLKIPQLIEKALSPFLRSRTCCFQEYILPYRLRMQERVSPEWNSICLNTKITVCCRLSFSTFLR